MPEVTLSLFGWFGSFFSIAFFSKRVNFLVAGKASVTPFIDTPQPMPVLSDLSAVKSIPLPSASPSRS